MARKLRGQGQTLSGSPSGTFSNFSPKPIQANRAPTTADTGYEIGQLWADTNGTTMYGLSAVSAGSATWNLLGPGASDVDTLTGDSGGAISPAAGNINIVGGNLGTFVGSGSTLTYTEGTNAYPITPYVVGSAGEAGYTTIQSAINAANAAGGGLVYVQPGTYTEDLTLFDKVHISSVIYENSFEVQITGTHTPPNSGEVSFRGVRLNDATAVFSSVAAGTTNISLEECTLAVTNGYSFNLPNWTGTINCNDCGSLGTNDGFVNNSGGSSVFTNNGQFGAGTTNTCNISGDCRLDLTFMDCPINISSGTLFVNFALFSQTLTLSGNVAGNIFLGDFFTGANPSLTMSTTGDIDLRNSTINTSNNPAITGAGAGTLTLTNIGFIDNAELAGTLTVAYGEFTSGALNVTGAHLIDSGLGNNITLKMGDAAGLNKVSFTDSADVEVFSIDSNGSIGTVTGLTVTGNFAQTGGTFNVGQDNAANAINIGGGTTARTIDLGSSAAAHVITIGSVTGAAQLDLLAGTGNFSVTGAATTTYTIGAATDTGTMTLGLSTAGQNIDIGSGVNAGAQVISIGNGASAANSTVNILSGVGTAGTGTLALGNNTRVTTIGLGDIAPAAARTVTICGGDSAQNDTLSVMSDNPSAGTQTVTLLGGVPTGGTQVLNLLTQTGQAGTVNVGTGAAMANNINIGGTGANTVAIGDTQTGGSVSVGAAMTTGTINIGGTGLQTGTITMGGGTGAQTIDIGTGGTGVKTINVGTGAIDNVVTIGTATGAASLDLLCGTGNFTLEGATTSTYTISGTGANTGTITISGGTGAQTTNIGTGGTGVKTVNIATGAVANVVTIGSTTGAASLTLQSGTGDITVTGTVKQIDAEFTQASGVYIPTINSNPLLTTAANTGGVPTGTTGATNLMAMQNGDIMEQFILGAGQTIIAPRMDAKGLLISLDLTNTEGAEYNFGARNLSKCAFTIGTDAAFFFEVGLYINDMDGAAPYVIGFRKVEANNATFGNYTDYATIGMIAASSTTNIVTATELNAGGQTVTDTTDAWGGDGSTNTLAVLVDASGNVTYTINGSPPSASVAFQFDAADVVMPFIRVEHSASATEVDITSLKCGYQA